MSKVNTRRWRSCTGAWGRLLRMHCCVGACKISFWECPPANLAPPKHGFNSWGLAPWNTNLEANNQIYYCLLKPNKEHLPTLGGFIDNSVYCYFCHKLSTKQHHFIFLLLPERVIVKPSRRSKALGTRNLCFTWEKYLNSKKLICGI